MAVDLTGDAPVLTVRVQKLYAFYADMALIAAVARAGGLVPTAWLRSAAGLMEWAASADAGVKPRPYALRRRAAMTLLPSDEPTRLARRQRAC